MSISRSAFGHIEVQNMPVETELNAWADFTVRLGRQLPGAPTRKAPNSCRFLMMFRYEKD